MRSLPRTALTALGALLLSAGMVLAQPAEVTTDLNMRTGPGTNFGVVTVVPEGDEVDIINCQGSWCRVRYGGRTGWVSAAYLGDTTVAAAPRRRVIVEEEPIYAAPPVVFGAPLGFGAFYGYDRPRRYYQGRYYGPRYDRGYDRRAYRGPVYRGGGRVAPGPVYRGGGGGGGVPSFGAGVPSAQGGGNQFVPGSGGGPNDSVGYR